MADWFRVPLWCHGRDRREEAAVAVYVLGEWHIGRAPSPLEVKTEFGWGWTRAARFLDTLWAWAGEANAVRPPASRAGPKAPKQASGEESGSERGANGEQTGSDDAGHKRIVETERGANGERSGSDRGASRARLPQETDVDEVETPTLTTPAALHPAAAKADGDPSGADAPLLLSDAWAKHLPTTAPTVDPIADAWAAMVARTKAPAAWKLTDKRRARLRALTKEHGADALAIVTRWFASDHKHAVFIRTEHGPDTVIRPANFEKYLSMALEADTTSSTHANNPPRPKAALNPF